MSEFNLSKKFLVEYL